MTINRTRIINGLAAVEGRPPDSSIASFVDTLIFELGGSEQPLNFVDPVHRKGNVITLTGVGTIADTTDLLAGDGMGNAVDSGIDPANVVQKIEPLPATPTTVNEIIALLQAYGLCSLIFFSFVFSAFSADFGDIPVNLGLSAGTSVRRNAGDTAFEAYTPGTFVEDHSVTLVVDGSGIVLGTGTKNPVKIPFGGTLQGWLVIGKPSGSVTVDIFRAADGAGLPVTSIIGSGTKPSLSSAVENSSTSFTSWTSTTLTAKDNLAISLSGITTTTYVALTLYFK